LFDSKNESNSQQFASEADEIGHGIFTYALIQGMKGSADGSENDKKITIQKLNSYLNDKVPELSVKYKGQIQYPNIMVMARIFRLF